MAAGPGLIKGVAKSSSPDAVASAARTKNREVASPRTDRDSCARQAHLFRTHATLAPLPALVNQGITWLPRPRLIKSTSFTLMWYSEIGVVTAVFGQSANFGTNKLQ